MVQEADSVPGAAVHFGDFEVRPRQRRLFRRGEPVKLGARAFDLLLALLERPDRVITKDELLNRAWPGLVVEEANVQVQVSALRKVLGADAIATIPGLGYRFAMAFARPDDPVSPAPADAGPDRHLPFVAGPLFGRDRDLESLRELLGRQRLVTITGPGGVGKTSVAATLARAQAERHADGVRWVDLAAVAADGPVAAVVAKALHVVIDGDDPTGSIVRGLRRRELLLVLDNCEHVARPVATLVAALLDHAPGVRVLATSQQPLRLRTEQLHRLAPLELPPSNAGPSQARACAALRLLEQRAQAVDHRFVIGDANVPAAAELCRLLDGLPLAIEMAAARLPRLGFDVLREMASAPLDALSARALDLPDRQLRLRSTLHWSHSLLTPDEQALLRRLAAFGGPFGLAVARSAAAFGCLEGARFHEALLGLVDKSLVKVADVQPPRYRLLETTRQYASERLDEAGERNDMHRRHGLALKHWAESLREAAVLGLPAGSSDRVLPEYDELDLAFERACERRDADVAAAVLLPLRQVDQLRGLLSNSTRRVARACALLDEAGPLAAARIHTFIATCGWTEPPVGSRLRSARRAVELWRQVDRPHELHDARAIAATESARAGQQAAAQAFIAEAHELEHPGWPRRSIAMRLIHEGWVARMGGDGRTAVARLREATAVFDALGEGRLADAVRVSLAEECLLTGDAEDAIAAAGRAADALHRFESSDCGAHVLSLLCQAQVVAGDVDGAVASAARAIELVEADSVHRFAFLHAVSVLLADTDRPRAAALMLGHARSDLRPDVELAPALKQRVQATEAALRTALGDEAADSLRLDGGRLSFDDAMRVAKQALRPDPASAHPP